MINVLGMADLTPTEKTVLAALAYHDGVECYPSMETLGNYLRMHRRKISAYLSAIKSKGRVTWKHSQHRNIYTIHYDNPTVCKTHTLEENPTVWKLPTSTVWESHTQTGKEPEVKEYTPAHPDNAVPIDTCINGGSNLTTIGETR